MSIRRTTIEECLGFERIRKKFPRYLTDSDALAWAMESRFRADSALGAIDGFEQFYVMEEDRMTLRVFGTAHFLPSSVLPLEAFLRLERDVISYQAIRALDDSTWKKLSAKKSWAAAHLYATEGYEPKWNWDRPIKGIWRSQSA